MEEQQKPREFREYCGEHSRCMEKFNSSDKWRDEMETKVNGLINSVMDLRIFRAQVLAIVVVAQILGGAAVTFILHFFGGK